MTSDYALCKECWYHVRANDGYGHKCGRLQKTILSRVNGLNTHKGPLLDCASEREERLTLKEHIFGENADKCGKGAKYWVSAVVP